MGEVVEVPFGKIAEVVQSDLSFVAHLAGEQIHSGTHFESLCHRLAGFPGLFHVRGVLSGFCGNGHPEAHSVRLVLRKFHSGGSAHEVERLKKGSAVLQKLADGLAMGAGTESAVQVVGKGGANIAFGHPFAKEAGVGVREFLISSWRTLRKQGSLQPRTVVAAGFEIAVPNGKLDESRVFAEEKPAIGLARDGCGNKHFGKGLFGEIRLDEIAILGEDNQAGFLWQLRQGRFDLATVWQGFWREDGSLSPADFFQ